MAFQITFSQAGEKPSDSLRRKEMRRFDQKQVEIGGQDCPLAGMSHPVLTITETAPGLYMATPVKGANILLQNAPLASETTIHSGDTLQAGENLLRFYVILPPARQSWTSRFLTGSAKGMLLLLFILQLLIMFWLPWELSASSIWDNASAKQQISLKMDATRNHLSNILKQEDLLSTQSLSKLLLSEIALDLEERARYLRSYDNQMTRSQRKNMVEDLNKIEQLLGRIEQGITFPKIPQPDLDGAVRATIQKYSHKH